MKRYYISIEIGGTNLRYGIISETFQVLDFKMISSAQFSKAEDKGAYIESLINPYLAEYKKEQLMCLTLSLASLMDRDRIINYNSPNLKGLNNISLVNILAVRTGLPVIMERDVNTALLYEIWKGRMDSSGIIVGIFIGTGLGNAMCINGELYIGNTGSACELGHIPVLGLHRRCGCGKAGCIELKASGKTLYRLAEKTYHCPVGEIFKRHGGELAVREVIRACAIAAATEITILDPRYVVLGGGVVKMRDFPEEYFIKTVKENLRIPYPRKSIRFRCAAGDPQAGIVGAAINARQRMKLQRNIEEPGRDGLS